jgi:hypothetical protein
MIAMAMARAGAVWAPVRGHGPGPWVCWTSPAGMPARHARAATLPRRGAAARLRRRDGVHAERGARGRLPRY